MRMQIVVLLVFLTVFSAHADVIHDGFGEIRLPLNLETEIGNLFPQCTAPVAGTENCPMKTTIRGFSCVCFVLSSRWDGSYDTEVDRPCGCSVA